MKSFIEKLMLLVYTQGATNLCVSIEISQTVNLQSWLNYGKTVHFRVQYVVKNTKIPNVSKDIRNCFFYFLVPKIKIFNKSHTFFRILT